MAIHDVDKHSDDRTSPAVNAHDAQNIDQRMAHGTNSANYTTDATGTPAAGVAAGGGAGVKYGFKRAVLIVPMTVTNNGATLTTATASHPLGYVPKVEADIENATVSTAGSPVTGATQPLPIFTSASIGGALAGAVTFSTFLYAFADASNVYVNLLNATGNPVTVTVTCYLYQRLAQ